MKTISAPAMAAIEAGDALVTGAVEIIPLGLTNFTTIGVINLGAVANAATTATGGLAAGVTISGFDPGDIVRVTEPAGLTFIAWSPWGVPAHTGFHTGSANRFNVIPDGIAADMFAVGTDPPGFDGTFGWDGYDAARAAFGVQTFTGASSYVLYLNDSPTSDNSGGLSIQVERGVAVGSAPPLYLWGGYWPIELAIDAGSAQFQPIGASGLIQQTSGAIGGVAQGLSLTLSGIEPKLLSLIEDADQYRGASAIIHRLIFASDGKTLLDQSVWDRGRLDTVQSDFVVGKDAALTAAVESAARSLGRSGARMRADSDQRLISPTDGYFQFTSYAGEKKSYWGGKIPSTVG